MVGIVGIITLLVVLALSLIITRLATAALSATGLSHQAARFQARSAFTGTGFTTSEAENVVNHPVRRRIIMLLMIVRSAGLITIIISILLSFVGTGAGPDRLVRLGVLVAGVMLLWWISTLGFVDRAMHRLIEKALRRWTSLDVRDYMNLLDLSENYAVHELALDEDSWLSGRALRDCRLREEGVIVLGIYRSDGSYVGAPLAETQMEPGDTLILYGRQETLEDLDVRQRDHCGEAAHQQAVSKQQEKLAEQELEEEQRKGGQRGETQASRSGTGPTDAEDEQVRTP